MSDRMDIDETYGHSQGESHMHGGDPVTTLISLREEIESTDDSELVGAFYKLEDLYERKLWYQLSELLESKVYRNVHSMPIRLRLYENFILSFGEKINQLKLVEFLLGSIEDSSPNDALEQLTRLKEHITSYAVQKSKKHGSDEDINDSEVLQALVMVESETARIKLAMGLVDEATAEVDECERKIDELNTSVDNRVNASYYHTNAQLMRHNGDYSGYYYSSLLFLACITDLNELPNKSETVHEICIAGLLGDKIYNFGEIIMHEIFGFLKEAWLKELVVAMNNGDLESFQKIVASSEFKGNSELSGQESFLRQKICIMALIGIVFNKPTNNKTVKYSEVLVKIPLLKTADEVERMTMKCLSLGLIKGLINQTGSEVEINWIQPRTMTMDQIVNMKNKLSFWSDRVDDLDNYMEDAGQGLWVQ